MTSLPEIAIIIIGIVVALLLLVFWEPLKIFVKSLVLGLVLSLVAFGVMWYLLGSLPSTPILLVVLIIIVVASEIIGFIKGQQH